MLNDPDITHAHQLMAHLMNGEGSLDQAEDWFMQLQKLVTNRIGERAYVTSGEMDNLEEIMAVRRRTEMLNQSVDDTTESSRLVATIQRIIDMQIHSDLGENIDLVDFEACFRVLRVAVPGAPWVNLILTRKENTKPEDILAEAYRLQMKSPETIKL